MSTADSQGSKAGQVHAWLFEAKGIQRWLFSSGRLRDVIGGSDLVARLARTQEGDLLSLAIAAQGNLVEQPTIHSASPANHISLARRAGGAFCVLGADRVTLIALRRTFLLRLLTAMPGLEYEDSLGTGPGEISARDNAREHRDGRRGNDPASVLPLGRPVFAINRRSGLPKTGEKTYRSDSIALDRMLTPQRDRADTLQQRFADGMADTSNLLRFVVDGAAERFHSCTQANEVFAYPRNLSDTDESTLSNPLFPWIADEKDRRIALVHADISGLGQMFQTTLVKDAAEALALGGKIEQAIIEAVGKAAAAVLLPHAVKHTHWNKIVPARPLVVGGDDVTVLVRADLALPFAVRLLVEIEDATREIGGGLSACAGVAISRAGQPFLALNTLAESLCAFAKYRAKQVELEAGQTWPSLLAFHVHSQTAEEDYEDDILPHLCPQGAHPLTGNPYAINPTGAALAGCAEWDQLEALARALSSVSGGYGAFREVAGEMAKGAEARSDMVNAKWRHFWRRSGLDALEQNLAGISGVKALRDQVPKCGEMFDALELIDLKVLGVVPSASPASSTVAVEETVG